MTVSTPAADDGQTAALRSVRVATTIRSAAVPLLLFLMAFGVRLVVARIIAVPGTEDGMYYEHVAARFVQGHGLTSLALWSYSTPPLVLPRPAFEIWMPGATLLSIPFMALFGASHAAAQLGSVLLGSTIAPIAWWLGRDAARALGLSAARMHAIAVGCGALAVILGVFVAADADPDSTTTFLVTSAVAAILMQRSLEAPSVTRGLLVGIALGAAYLTRQEAVWLAVTYLLMLAATSRAWEDGRSRRLAQHLLPVIGGGLLVVCPWLLRQWLAFGTPLPGQAAENALHIRGEDIFGYSVRPSVERFLAQGLDTLVAQRATALAYQAQGLLVTAFPVGLVGIIGSILLARTPAFRASGALFALVVGGALIFVATALLFPIATLWGTYRHSAGPLILGCVVASVLLGDLLVRRVAARFRRRHAATWLAPMILVAAALPVGWAWVSVGASDATLLQSEMTVVGDAIRAELPLLDNGYDTTPASTADVMSNLPIFTATVSGRRVLALPDEPPQAVVALARRFGVRTLVVIGERGRYPDALLTAPRHPCLEDDPVLVGAAREPVWLFRLRAACEP